MPTVATRRYTGQTRKLTPVQDGWKAIADAIRLQPGSYNFGTVMGQSSTWTAANEVQTITVSGTPTGGNFYLIFNGDLIGPIAYNAAIAAVQALLDADPQIGAGNSVVAGGPFPGSTMTVTFQGQCAGLRQPLMTLGANGLTGGSSPTASVARTTPGQGAGGYWIAYDDTLSGTGYDIARSLLMYDCVVNTYGQIQSGGGEWGEKSLSCPAYFSGEFRGADIAGLDANGVTDLGARFKYGTLSNLTAAGNTLIIPG